MKLPASLRALEHRNFRLFLMGQGTSQIGSWIQLVATSWLVFSLSGSTLMLGLAAFTLQIPLLVITPFAGVWIDRLDVRRVLYVTNTMAICQALVMLAILLFGQIEAWHLVLGNLVLGLGNAFDAPARQALILRLLPSRNELPNAIALNATVMNGARFIGPMVGGLVTALLGEVWSFGLNCLMRGAVVYALAQTDLKHRVISAARAGWGSQLMAGLRYAYGFLPSRCALLLLAATSFSLQSYGSLMPWFASERFQGDSRMLGLLLSCSGLGAVCGMLYLATRSSIRGLFKVIGWSAGMASVAMILFSFADGLWLALPMLFLAALGMMLTAAATNTVLQTIVPDELRGRVAAIYVMSFLGMSPLGSLLTGWLAQHLGTPHTLALCGALSLVGVGFYVRSFSDIRREILPLYEKLEIPPTVD
ncbi:MAG: MFS transporter [Betaproteobacteria bacterium]|nr:MFS transporter [Burkholderiales bacterium]NBX15146.1 MFS transporter [Betaproteobacteria bacterium]NBX90659.1 MFS transporter [Betaproteobacteria bacterium]